MLLDRLRLDGKTAIITGAGRGIGAAIARAFGEVGGNVVITARTEAQLREVAKDVEASGSRAVIVPGDVNEDGFLASLVDQAVNELGGVDIAVNNAGGSPPRAFLDTSTAMLEKAFHFNVTTAFELSRAAVPRMLERGGGAIVNISSAMGRLTDRGFVAYGTAKGALSHMTRLMASDLAPKIRVNGIAVGSVATSALEVVLTDDGLRNEMVERTPLKRLGEPEDIALAALYLASPAGQFVTGKMFEIDGGIEYPNLGLNLPDL
jgi:7-alpha-hydroxysteroid dehydrogenase